MSQVHASEGANSGGPVEDSACVGGPCDSSRSSGPDLPPLAGGAGTSLQQSDSMGTATVDALEGMARSGTSGGVRSDGYDEDKETVLHQLQVGEEVGGMYEAGPLGYDGDGGWD